MTEKYSFFVAIAPYEELTNIARLIPKTWKFYVKCNMEQAGTRKIVIITGSNKVSMEHVVRTIPFLIQICPSTGRDGKTKHILTTQYIRWRPWMRARDYEKLSDEVRKRTKFIDRPHMPDKENPYKVKNFFIERMKGK